MSLSRRDYAAYNDPIGHEHRQAAAWLRLQRERFMVNHRLAELHRLGHLPASSWQSDVALLREAGLLSPGQRYKGRRVQP